MTHLWWRVLTSNTYIVLTIGKYLGIALLAVFYKFRKHVLPHLPHRHTGYVSTNGSVHNCRRCGKPPANLEAQLAKVRAEIAEHPWKGPYMGPDRTRYRLDGRPRYPHRNEQEQRP